MTLSLNDNRKTKSIQQIQTTKIVGVMEAPSQLERYYKLFLFQQFLNIFYQFSILSAFSTAFTPGRARRKGR